MKKNFRFCILFIFVFLFNTLIAKAERVIKRDDITIKNDIIYFKDEKTSYTGIMKDYHKNGKVKNEWTVVNGLVNGLAKVYYENGNLKYEAYLKNNKQDGIVKNYYPNGKLEMEIPFKDGIKEGVQK